MLLLPRSVRILLAAKPIDMRNSIDGLAAIIRNEWKEDLYAGDLFIFVSRRGDRTKVLTWDNGGFVLFYKRLEQGRFRLPAFRERRTCRARARLCGSCARS
ncbi:MAG TPA: IS66 family insertion sequence element accessory protein TnpB [Myxococcaceae bacterium]|nr:IS66 family insertion sequence element accessory protein TnpB [Myxococcaceae bacterium]